MRTLLLTSVVFYCSIFLPSIHLVVALTSPQAAQSPPSSSPLSSVRQLATNWFSIAAHLQDPTLYSAAWANGCDYRDGTLVTLRNVEEGEIISLCAIHAIGLEPNKDDHPHGQKDWIVFDHTKDSDYFSPLKKRKGSVYSQKGFQRKNTADVKAIPPKQSPFCYHIHSENYPTELQGQTVFCDVNPTRFVQPGWQGHLAAKGGENDSGNCIIVPIALPLCALVSTKEMDEGTRLLQREERYSQAARVMKRYRNELGELRRYMDMAYPKSSQPEQEDIMEEKEEDHPPIRFYDFPRDNLKLEVLVLHEDPNIYSIPNFLSESECDRLIQKAQPHLIPCVTKNPKTGAVERDSSRTSTNTNIPQTEVPTIVKKLTELANCTAENLEVLQLLHYAPGEYFNKHTDGFAGRITACGFDQSARLVTIFVYLNDVSEGGETRFTKLGVDVKPQKGTAVVHFPTTLDFKEDTRTEHQGMVAIDEKFLLVTWVWMHPRDQQSLYAEEYLDPLSIETI